MDTNENSLMQEIYSPVDSYKSLFKDLHNQNTINHFNEMVKKSQIDIEANRATNKKIAENEEKRAGTNKAIKWQNIFKFIAAAILAVATLTIVYSAYEFWDTRYFDQSNIIVVAAAVILMILSLWMFKKIKRKLGVLNKIEEKLLEITKKYQAEAEEQMRLLNNQLRVKNYHTELFSKTLPLVQFDKIFDHKRMGQMIERFGFSTANHEHNEQYTRHIQSGEIKGNPFIFRNFRKHTMGTKEYSGSLYITWTTQEKDSQGNYKTVHHSETLYANVQKPCPYYTTLSQLVYANEAGDKLTFSRQPSKIHELRDRKVDKLVKSRSKELQKLAEKSIKTGGNFTALGNNEFDALFYAKNRDNEAQFRLLFTPLAQKELSKIIKDNSAGFGDDFSFYKQKMINFIYPEHLNDIVQNVKEGWFTGIDFDKVEKRFINYHNSYFKHIFFSFAPLFAIPLYTQHQTHEHIYKELYDGNVNFYYHEEAASCLPLSEIAPHDCATVPIYKTSLLNRTGNTDTVLVNAWGYKTVKRTDYIRKRGGDGYYHDVPVHWNEYIKVSRKSKIEVKVASDDNSIDKDKATGYLNLGLILARMAK